MTPQEKANELSEKFWQELKYIGDHPRAITNTATYCAIACVDEIVKSYSAYKGMHDQEFFDNEVNFWTAVLNHLKQMK